MKALLCTRLGGPDDLELTAPPLWPVEARWEAAGRQFLTSDMNSFARQGSPRVAVSVAGGSGPVR